MRKSVLTILIVILLLASGLYLRQNTNQIKTDQGSKPRVKKESPTITVEPTKAISPTKSPAKNNTDFPLTFPDGFTLSIFAKNINEARMLEFDPVGNLLVSSRQGRVFVLPDKNNDGAADENVLLLSGLSNSQGLAFRCKEKCQLYVGETHRVTVYNYDQDNFKLTNEKKIIDLPGGGQHSSRSLLYDPNLDKLFISVGSTCNVCNESDLRRAKILISNPDGSDLKTYASGLRNSVVMALHRITKQLWATEMGRDHLGDDLPPDEINIIKEGKDYGWPNCYGKNVADKSFNSNVDCSSKEPSYIDMQAHSAPLGLAFFPEKGWPEEYKYNLLVAYHGSWNRSTPTGYKIVRYKLDKDGKYLGEEDFVKGWQTSSGWLGRPVGIAINEKGIIYISDDEAGVIYRMIYK